MGNLTIVFALTTSLLSAQTLEVKPARALDDQPPTIRATGLQPGEHVTIHADLTDGADHPWHSQAEFIADAQGMVDVSEQAPVKGSYRKRPPPV